METTARRIYVISDLHIAGPYHQGPRTDSARLNTNVAALARFLSEIGGRPGDNCELELVLNGDTFDFLAGLEAHEVSWVPLAGRSRQAKENLRAIAEGDKQFFDALRVLLNRGVRLTVLTGNHDLELAFPEVRRTLEELLGIEKSGLFHIVPHGESYAVGQALIEHGNRFDRYNRVRHTRLHAACCHAARERRADPSSCPRSAVASLSMS